MNIPRISSKSNMSTFALLLLCIQACLVQKSFSQYLRPAGLIGLGYRPEIPLTSAITSSASIEPTIIPYGLNGGLSPMGIAPMAVGVDAVAPAVIDLGGYGGSGVGDVAIVGELPVLGTTLIAGQVPILGTVRFAGDLPAAGSVTIVGSCGCGCGRALF